MTATRRETNLQETPLAISALSQATLDENHVNTLLDMRGLVPNLQFFSNGDHAVPLVFIRGLGTRNQTEAGDQGIAFYTDGVFSARSQGTTVMMYDLDRVEVHLQLETRGAPHAEKLLIRLRECGYLIHE